MRAKEFAKHIFEQVKRDWHIPVTEHQVYSTAETVVGVWTDGKPLYRKTFTGTTASTDTFEAPTNLPSCDHVAVVRAEVKSNGYSANFACQNLFIDAKSDGSTIWFFLDARRWKGVPYIVTLEYTKTTDTAASPKVPFEPLHEWSTNEKLVGYWIDGKPVYEKTITGTSPADRGEINTGISNVSNAVITQMRITNAAGYNANFAFTTVSADIKADGSKIWFEYSSDNFKSRPFTATIQYTKTTD